MGSVYYKKENREALRNVLSKLESSWCTTWTDTTDTVKNSLTTPLSRGTYIGGRAKGSPFALLHGICFQNKPSYKQEMRGTFDRTQWERTRFAKEALAKPTSTTAGKRCTKHFPVISNLSTSVSSVFRRATYFSGGKRGVPAEGCTAYWRAETDTRC